MPSATESSDVALAGPPRIAIGNQTHCHTPARVPYQFALAHRFDAFEWFSDKGASGWCENDTYTAERTGLRQEAQDAGVCLSVHAPHAADPTTADGAAAVRRSIEFAGAVG